MNLSDPETQTRIAQYEMAFRMQSSVPDLVDVGQEPKHGAGDVRSRRDEAGYVRQQPACLRAGWRNVACVSVPDLPTAAGTTTMIYRIISGGKPARSIDQPGRWSRISNAVDCWTTRS